MTKDILILFTIFFLFGCQQNLPTKRLVVKDEIVNTDTVFIVNDAPIPINNQYHRDSLTRYFYPSLTAWGGLTVWYDKNKIRIIEAKHSAELGYKKRIFYLNNGRIIKAEIEDHIADWQAFFKKYGENALIEDSIMIYADDYEVYDSVNIKLSKTTEEEQIENEGNQILKFLMEQDPFNKNK